MLSESQAPVVALLQECRYGSVRDPPCLRLRSSARRTISRQSLAAGLTAIIHLLQTERIHHDPLVVITSPNFSSYCPRWTSGTGWLQLSFALCFSSYCALSRFAVLWFALPAVGFALVPAVGFALLGSFHRCSRSSMFFSCYITSFFSSFHHWLFACGSFCCEVWSERFVASAARRRSPMPLCDVQDCVHLHNEGLHRGLLSLRGPVVLPTPQGGHRSSLLFLSSGSD